MQQIKIKIPAQEITALLDTDTLPTDPPPPQNDPKAFYGVNDFHWTPIDRLQQLGIKSVRTYIASGWVWRPGGLFVQPMYQAETATVHGLDDYFASCKAAGIDVLPCINQTPDWFNGKSEGTGSNNWPPIQDGVIRTDPRSWYDYAEFWFQFVARYGSKPHPDQALSVDTNPKYSNQPLNIKKSGLNLINKVEIGNEWDRWWDKDNGTRKYLYPEEYAAMIHACYVACKSADPNITVIMGGLTGFDLDYLHKMDAAFRNMGVPFMSDVINVHHYSNRGNKLGVWPPTWETDGACLPNNDPDFPTITKVIDFAQSINKPVWVTEFGYDSKGPSWAHITPQSIMVSDILSDEVAQAFAIETTFQAYKALGVERAYVFEAADEGGTGLWQTCGLMTSQADGFKPKPAFKAVQYLLEKA